MGPGAVILAQAAYGVSAEGFLVCETSLNAGQDATVSPLAHEQANTLSRGKS